MRKLRSKLGLKSSDQVEKEQEEKKDLVKEFEKMIHEAEKEMEALKLPGEVREILDAVNLFLRENDKHDPKTLFQELDSNGSGTLKFYEFEKFFSDLRMQVRTKTGKDTPSSKFLTENNLQKLFEALDQDKNRKLDLKEFCVHVMRSEKDDFNFLNNLDEETSKKVE